MLKAPLEQVFHLTNQVKRPWEHNGEILWLLPDKRLRSTSMGDIVVSLASGAAWVADCLGCFQLITEYNSNQKQALAVCEALTNCFYILYEANRSEGDQKSMDLWFEICCLEIGEKAFFEALGAKPQWIGNRRTGTGCYRFTDKQLALIGRLDPENVPDLDEWYYD